VVGYWPVVVARSPGGIATSVAGLLGQLILHGARERGQQRLLKST
jgi:hypothetical protein